MGNDFTNDSSIPKHFVHLRILSSAFSKSADLKFGFLDKRIIYPQECQAWEPNAADIKKIETVWNGSLGKMVPHKKQENGQEQFEWELD